MMHTLRLYESLPKDIKNALKMTHLPLGHIGVGNLDKFKRRKATTDARLLIVGLNPAATDKHHISDKVIFIGNSTTSYTKNERLWKNVLKHPSSKKLTVLTQKCIASSLSYFENLENVHQV
jgi:hypothetical protein